MTKVAYWAPYYMCLVLSSKRYVSALYGLNLLIIIGLAYLGVKCFPICCEDALWLFKPNSQDYFRTVLLGFLSPNMIFFIKAFILDITASYRFQLTDMIVEYLLEDWFMFFVLHMLSYPQMQGEYTDNVNWRLIPKQSYIFGVSWALNEFLSAILANLNGFEESPYPRHNCGSSSTLGTWYSGDETKKLLCVEGMRSEELNAIRNGISLSKCMDVRRHSSKISNNIYENRLHSTHSMNNYDSFSDVGSKVDSHELVLAFSGDGLNLLEDMDSRLVANGFKSQPRFHYGYGRTYQQFSGYVPPSSRHHTHHYSPTRHLNASPCDVGGKSADTMGSGSNNNGRSEITYFERIHSWDTFWQKVFIADMIVIFYFLQTIGQVMLMSMFFLYIKNRDDLFTAPMKHFGHHSYRYFIMVFMVPFCLLDIIYHIFLFFWKDEEAAPEHISTALHSGRTNQNYSALQTNYHSNNIGGMSSILIAPHYTSSGTEFDNYLFVDSSYTQNSLTEPDETNCFLSSFRWLLLQWRSLATIRGFLVTGAFVWSLTTFLSGVLITRRKCPAVAC